LAYGIWVKKPQEPTSDRNDPPAEPHNVLFGEGQGTSRAGCNSFQVSMLTHVDDTLHQPCRTSVTPQY
jgi:hypothetical protein